MVFSIILSLAGIVKFIQKNYRSKLTYQSLVVIQVIHIIGLILRFIYQIDFPDYVELAKGGCTNLVLFGIVYVDLNILKLFSALDDRINSQIINSIIYGMVIFFVWTEVTFSISVMVVAPIFYKVTKCNSVVFLSIRNISGMRIIIHQFPRNILDTFDLQEFEISQPPNKAAIKDFYINLGCNAITDYYLGNFNVSITGIHSILASVLFEQFKNMILTQVKKPAPIAKLYSEPLTVA
ncbi:hypothetical protein HDV06_004029 [Boothiomyces sp. JEL0866]|nr:hypothetical protein HDV06_004029 [Boothiomyces sp. JEL0866]